MSTGRHPGVSTGRIGESTEVQQLQKRVAEYRRILRAHQTARIQNPRRIAICQKELAERIEMLAAARAGA